MQITKEPIAIAGLRLGWFPIVLGALLLVVNCLPEVWRTSWYFYPEKYLNGQWWLPFSSQWVHLNIQHTVSNIGSFFLLYVLILDKETTVRLFLCTASCMLSISAYLALFPDSYAYYAGFSGVLYGLLLLGGLNYWQSDKRISFLVITVITLKILWDILGPTAFEYIDWLGARIAVEVHLAGIIGTGIFVLINRVLENSK